MTRWEGLCAQNWANNLIRRLGTTVETILDAAKVLNAGGVRLALRDIEKFRDLLQGNPLVTWWPSQQSQLAFID